MSLIGGMTVHTAKENVSPSLASRTAIASALLVLLSKPLSAFGKTSTRKNTPSRNKEALKINRMPEDLLRKPSAFAFGYVPIVLAMGVAAIPAVLLVNIFPFWFAILRSD